MCKSGASFLRVHNNPIVSQHSPVTYIKTTCSLLKRGILKVFFSFFMYAIQNCFICRTSDSTVSEDAGIEPRTLGWNPGFWDRTQDKLGSNPGHAGIELRTVLYSSSTLFAARLYVTVLPCLPISESISDYRGGMQVLPAELWARRTGQEGGHCPPGRHV
jgi:hypothetical protein